MGIPAANGVDAAGLPNKGDQANAVVSGTLGAIGPGDAFAFRGPMNFSLWASYNTALTTTAGSLNASVASAGAIAPGDAIAGANLPWGTTVKTIAGTALTLALPAYTYFATGLGVQNQNVTLPPGSNVNQLLGATVTVPSNVEGITFAANTTVAAIIQQDVAATGNSPGTPGIIALSTPPLAVPNDTQPHPLRFALAGAAVAAGVDAAAIFTGLDIKFTATVQIEKSFDGGFTWLVASMTIGGTPAQYSLGTPVVTTFGEPEKNVQYRPNCIAYTSGVINYRFSQTGGAAESLAIGPLSNG